MGVDFAEKRGMDKERGSENRIYYPETAKG